MVEVDLHPSVEEILRRLAVDSPRTAADARSAFEWILGPSRGLHELTLLGLGQFLWYELPWKWLLSPAVQSDVVGALATALDLAGLHRYAAECRSDRAEAVLAAYRHDPAAGFAAFRCAVDAIGVEPPDVPRQGRVPAFRWGEVMGPDEHEAWWATAAMLELAVAGGLLVPGGRGTSAARRRLVAAHLALARPELGGRSLRQVVEDERLVAWAGRGRGRTRPLFLEPTVPLLRSTSGELTSAIEVAVPVVRPLHDLLVAVSDTGLVLTERGNLPPAVVTALAAGHGWLPPGRRARSERQAPEIGRLRELAVTTRLVEVSGRRLRLRGTGRAALVDQAMLVITLTGDLSRTPFQRAALELHLASLLTDPGATLEERRWEVAVVLTEEGWTVGGPNGSPLPLDQVATAVERWTRLVGALPGCTLGAGAPAATGPAATGPAATGPAGLGPAGRALALLALHRLATHPQPAGD